MRKILLGAVAAACVVGCGGGGSDGAADEAAFYTAFCEQFIPCASSYPADITQAECEAYYGGLGVAALVPDPGAAASCMRSASGCEAAARDCLPQDATSRCTSATTLKECQGGICILQDCVDWCDFTGELGGSCVPDDVDGDYCECD